MISVPLGWRRPSTSASTPATTGFARVINLVINLAGVPSIVHALFGWAPLLFFRFARILRPASR
jgi:ABC-type phosphate transport system permease subunit